MIDYEERKRIDLARFKDNPTRMQICLKSPPKEIGNNNDMKFATAYRDNVDPTKFVVDIGQNTDEAVFVTAEDIVENWWID